MRPPPQFPVLTFARDSRLFVEVTRGLGGRLGVYLDGGSSLSRVVSPDSGGELWLLAEGEERDCVRWCIFHWLRVHPTLGELARSLRAGQVVGLLPDLAPALAVPLASVLRAPAPGRARAVSLASV